MSSSFIKEYVSPAGETARYVKVTIKTPDWCTTNKFSPQTTLGEVCQSVEGRDLGLDYVVEEICDQSLVAVVAVGGWYVQRRQQEAETRQQ